MGNRILILQGHPDSSVPHLCHALADAYAAGAEGGGRQVRQIDIARLGLPYITSVREWEEGTPGDTIQKVQADIEWADHIVLIYPLWIGTVPAVVKGFLEQVFRKAFILGTDEGGSPFARRLRGRSARIIVTMGMPVPLYRWYFGAHGLKNLERNAFRFSGFGPVRDTLFGMVDAASEATKKRWLDKCGALGRKGI